MMKQATLLAGTVGFLAVFLTPSESEPNPVEKTVVQTTRPATFDRKKELDYWDYDGENKESEFVYGEPMTSGDPWNKTGQDPRRSTSAIIDKYGNAKHPNPMT